MPIYYEPFLLGISGGRSNPSGLRCRLGFGLGFVVAVWSVDSIFSGFGCRLALATSLIFFFSSCSCFLLLLVAAVSAKIALTGKLVPNLLEITLKWLFFILANDK